MKRKRVYAFLLAAVTATGLMAGCGQGGNQDAKNAVVNTGENGTEELQQEDTEVIGTEDADASQEEVETPAYPEILSDEAIEDYGSVVRVGDAAYELYTYLDDVAETYATSVNTVAKNLDGQCTVYDLVIPLGSGIIFPDNLRDQIKSGDQQEAIQNIQGKMDPSVQFVDIYDTLMTHRNEYIYFRTDHHWTALGAYYAYTDFCSIKGIEPEAIESYTTKEFDGFLGSFYNDTNEDSKLGDNPDVVTAYEPNMDAICHIEDSRGIQYDSPVIYDETNAAAGLKYSAFIAGDNPYTEIVNNELTDGSSCIVVKESFGNAFVPFLVDHYQTIYVVDYRYWTGSISELAAEKGVQDVIFVNNLSMIRNKSLVGKLFRLL